MTFFRTEMLFFIWAVPLLLLVIIFGMRRRREIMGRFASVHGLKVIAPDTVGARRWVKAALLLGAVLFSALALAGPKYGYRWQEIRQQGVDIIIALDCSRSMTAADIQPTRNAPSGRSSTCWPCSKVTGWPWWPLPARPFCNAR